MVDRSDNGNYKILTILLKMIIKTNILVYKQRNPLTMPSRNVWSTKSTRYGRRTLHFYMTWSWRTLWNGPRWRPNGCPMWPNRMARITLCIASFWAHTLRMNRTIYLLPASSCPVRMPNSMAPTMTMRKESLAALVQCAGKLKLKSKSITKAKWTGHATCPKMLASLQRKLHRVMFSYLTTQSIQANLNHPANASLTYVCVDIKRKATAFLGIPIWMVSIRY